MGIDSTFGGLRVITSLFLEEDGEPVTVRRTWRERLLTRPWRPLLATRVVIPKVPYRGAVRLNATTLVMHPATLRALQKQCDLMGSDSRFGG